MKSRLQEEFKKRYQKEADKVFFCPGRVNLIGEHIDYNGGNVMPCAITLGIFMAVSGNDDNVFRFQSLDFPEAKDIPLQDEYVKTGKDWFNYPLGVINVLVKAGHKIKGLDMLFSGNLPVGAGLSSSAAIEVLTFYTFDRLFKLGIPQLDLALLSKKVENEFIGVNSGIMDQFAVAFGEKNKAILLNTDTLVYEYMPLELQDYLLAIINTNKQRKLADSKYNERFDECRRALKALQKEVKVDNLCDIDLPAFEAHRHLINDPVLEKRALHVVSEQVRVNEAVIALKAGDLKKFGELMYASHHSLKDLYEVSGVELDTIVEFCQTYEGVIGARMTGAGFGGCAIALVKKDGFDDFSKQIISYYKEKIGYDPGVFASEIGDGVKEE